MTNLEKAKELRQFVCNTHMANRGKALNMLSLHNQRNADLENIWKLCEKTAVEMARWKDEQFTKQKQALIDKACDLYRSDLQQFQNLLGKIRKSAKGMIDIDGSLSDFRKAMEGETR